MSFLARELAKKIALSSKENRENSFKRLKINIEGRTKELVDYELAQDHEYLLEQALSSMTLVFVETFGYILFKALGERIHDIGLPLLNNSSLKELKEKADFYKIAEHIRTESTKEDDIVSIAWYAFRHVIDQMMASPWKQSYQTARNRTRFNHSNETRSKIYKELDQLDEFMKRTQVTKPWAAGIPEKIGLYKHFKKILWE